MRENAHENLSRSCFYISGSKKQGSETRPGYVDILKRTNINREPKKIKLRSHDLVGLAFSFPKFIRYFHFVLFENFTSSARD